MVAVELAVCTLAHQGKRDITLRIRSDNMGVIGSFDAGRSRNAQQNSSLRRILLLLHERNLGIKFVWVPSAENKADGPSRSLSGPLESLLPLPHIPFTLRNLVCQLH
jgi:hypothetical protein